MPGRVVAGPILTCSVQRGFRNCSRSSHRHDYVILDTPPLVPVVDSVFCRVVDGVSSSSREQDARRLPKEGLNALDPPRCSLVFTTTPVRCATRQQLPAVFLAHTLSPAQAGRYVRHYCLQRFHSDTTSGRKPCTRSGRITAWCFCVPGCS
jgi:hypothetical protein